MGKSDIEWCDWVWNPITGCLHGCPYCYARSIARRFSGNIKANFAAANYEEILNGVFELKEPVIAGNGRQVIYPFGFAPTFHEFRLDDIDKPIGGKNIFVGAMADVFGDWVPDEWILRIIDKAAQTPRHNYLFLTKNPQKMHHLHEKGLLPVRDNFWYGTTVTTKDDIYTRFVGSFYQHTFMSIEPLHENLDIKNWGLSSCDWVIIGAETGRRKDKIVPKKEWVDNILDAASFVNTPVFMKDSMIPIVGEENMRREFPEQLQRREPGKKYKEMFYGRCFKCGKEAEKKTMITLSAKKGRDGEMKTLCQICDSCFEEFKREIEKGGNNG